jgi:DNA-binding NtrC family response regulator
MTPEATECLRRYKWPGNVRELKNVVHRAYIISEGEIAPSSLPGEIVGGGAAVTLGGHRSPVHAWSGAAGDAQSAPRTDASSAPSPAASSTPARASRLSANGSGTMNGSLEVHVGCSIAEAEKQLILATVERLHGNKREAAKTLGISLRSLYNRLKAYREDGDEPAAQD